MGADPRRQEETGQRYDFDEIFDQLEELEETVSDAHERREVRRLRDMVKQVTRGPVIRKYTSRDIAEGVVGGIVFSLPLLVEDGVFDIAAWFAQATIGPVPIFLLMNILLIVALVNGLLYYTDIRTIEPRPVLRIIPRRLVAILCISLVVATLTMFLWGRLHENDPTRLEQVGRITVIWAAAALGATLADILPGESKGQDLRDLITSPDRSLTEGEDGGQE